LGFLVIKRIVITVCCISIFSGLYIPCAQAVNGVGLQTLAEHKQWLHLLHYRSHSLLGRRESENDTASFFVHKNGKTDPLAELKASIELFALSKQADNESLQCRFPARYQWLKGFFPHWSDQSCSELNEWKTEIDAHKLTLIFPASYLNSPSSMYGHTLIRLDRKDEAKSKFCR
jgi:hypothetical protein